MESPRDSTLALLDFLGHQPTRQVTKKSSCHCRGRKELRRKEGIVKQIEMQSSADIWFFKKGVC